jgi:hypothetical protein
MDPLSAAASIIAVIQISEQVVTVCLQYYRTARAAKTDILQIVNVVGGLKTTLENLKLVLDSAQEDEWSHLSSLDRPLESCYGVLDSLARTLGVQATEGVKGTEELKFNFQKRLTWPWKQKELDRVLGMIERHKEMFILAVAGNTLQGTQRIQADVQEIQQGIGRLKADLSEVKRNRILDWVSGYTSIARHEQLRKERVSSSGSWFLSLNEFTSWMNGTATNCPLLCLGIGMSISRVLLILLSRGRKVGVDVHSFLTVKVDN